MGTDAAIEAVRRFRSELARHGVRPERVILFGSYAHGTPHEDSDIDVVVISRDFEGRDLLERIRMMTPVMCGTHAPIEAIAMTPEEWTAARSPVVDFAADGVDVGEAGVAEDEMARLRKANASDALPPTMSLEEAKRRLGLA